MQLQKPDWYLYAFVQPLVKIVIQSLPTHSSVAVAEFRDNFDVIYRTDVFYSTVTLEEPLQQSEVFSQDVLLYHESHPTGVGTEGKVCGRRLDDHLCRD